MSRGDQVGKDVPPLLGVYDVRLVLCAFAVNAGGGCRHGDHELGCRAYAGLEGIGAISLGNGRAIKCNIGDVLRVTAPDGYGQVAGVAIGITSDVLHAIPLQTLGGRDAEADIVGNVFWADGVKQLVEPVGHRSNSGIDVVVARYVGISHALVIISWK